LLVAILYGKRVNKNDIKLLTYVHVSIFIYLISYEPIYTNLADENNQTHVKRYRTYPLVGKSSCALLVATRNIQQQRIMVHMVGR
jgi:hypothetical protein